MDLLKGTLNDAQTDAQSDVKLLQGIVDEATDRLGTIVTVERQGLADDLHGLLDRLNGTTVLMEGGGLVLHIPPRTVPKS